MDEGVAPVDAREEPEPSERLPVKLDVARGREVERPDGLVDGPRGLAGDDLCPEREVGALVLEVGPDEPDLAVAPLVEVLPAPLARHAELQPLTLQSLEPPHGDAERQATVERLA